jgi:hypothetical protein
MCSEILGAPVVAGSDVAEIYCLRRSLDIWPLVSPLLGIACLCSRMGGPRQAVFNLNCPSGSIELRENFGFSWPEVNRLARSLQTHVQPLCAAWRAIHGNY